MRSAVRVRSAEEDPRCIQMLHCVRSSSHGGEPLRVAPTYIYVIWHQLAPQIYLYFRIAFQQKLTLAD
jgi:hypothetical protein